MGEFVSVVISGIAIGSLYGLVGFTIVALFRATGVLSFAQANLAMFNTFITYLLVTRAGAPLWLSVILGLVSSALLGLVLYGLVMRPVQRVEALNLVLRTLAVYMILFAVANTFWAAGQPFRFQVAIPSRAVHVGRIPIPIHTIVVLCVVGVVGGAIAVFFRHTKLGLVFRAVGDRPDTTALLGIRTNVLAAIAWMAASVLTLVAGLMTAPIQLLSSDMMSSYVLFAFAGALLGGLYSWAGVFIGGILVGLVANIASYYISGEIGAVVVFLALMVGLILRPEGMFGNRSHVRL